MNPAHESLSGLIDHPCLYSTIFAGQVDPSTGEVVDALYDEAAHYCEAISQGIKAFHTKEYPTNDLMRYFCLPDAPELETAIKRKIRSAVLSVETAGKTLYAKLKLDMEEDLTNGELEAFAAQIESQYKDGWGAEFELINIPAGQDAVCLRLWHSSFSFFSSEERALLQSQRQRTSKGKKHTKQQEAR